MHGIVPHKGWIVSVCWIQFRAIALQLECADSLLNPKQWISYGSFEATAYFCHRSGNVAFLECLCLLHLCSLSSMLFACLSIAHYHQKFRKQALRTVLIIHLFIYWFMYVLIKLSQYFDNENRILLIKRDVGLSYLSGQFVVSI